MPRGGEEGGAPPLSDFSLFREIIREEREAAQAEREAAAAEARVERETVVAEQRHLIAEVFELKLRLAEERERRSGVAGGEPCTAGSRGRPRGPIESAVQSGATTGSERITNPGGTAIGLDGRMHIEPMRRMESESNPSPARSQASTSSRNGDSGAAPVQRENSENQVKQIKYVPLFDGTKAKFPLGSRIVSAWPDVTACLGSLQMESIFQLPTKRCLSLLYRRAFPIIMFKTISLPGPFSHGLTRIMDTVILYATLPHQLQDDVR